MSCWMKLSPGRGGAGPDAAVLYGRWQQAKQFVAGVTGVLHDPSTYTVGCRGPPGVAAPSWQCDVQFSSPSVMSYSWGRWNCHTRQWLPFTSPGSCIHLYALLPMKSWPTLLCFCFVHCTPDVDPEELKAADALHVVSLIVMGTCPSFRALTLLCRPSHHPVIRPILCRQQSWWWCWSCGWPRCSAWTEYRGGLSMQPWGMVVMKVRVEGCGGAFSHQLGLPIRKIRIQSHSVVLGPMSLSMMTSLDDTVVRMLHYGRWTAFSGSFGPGVRGQCGGLGWWLVLISHVFVLTKPPLLFSNEQWHYHHI